jgi:hypothetical protein
MLPVGCVFHPRCRYAMDICREQSPPLDQPAIGTRASSRVASCWLQDGDHQVPAELARPEPGSEPGPDQLAPTGAATSTAASAASSAAAPEHGSLA